MVNTGSCLCGDIKWTVDEEFTMFVNCHCAICRKVHGSSYGAFVELKEGIDGLVHISQISEERIEKVKDVLDTGAEIKARVIKIDRDERRIGLSIKAAEYDDSQLAAETAGEF